MFEKLGIYCSKSVIFYKKTRETGSQRQCRFATANRFVPLWFVCLYVYKSIYLCVYYMSVCIYICVSICLCVCVSLSVSVYVCVCLYLCLCLGLCMCVYVNVYSESRQHFITLQPVPFWKIFKASQWLQYMICACKWGIIFLKIISKIYVGSVIQNVFIIIFIRL